MTTEPLTVTIPCSPEGLVALLAGDGPFERVQLQPRGDMHDLVFTRASGRATYSRSEIGAIECVKGLVSSLVTSDGEGWTPEAADALIADLDRVAADLPSGTPQLDRVLDRLVPGDSPDYTTVRTSEQRPAP